MSNASVSKTLFFHPFALPSFLPSFLPPFVSSFLPSCGAFEMSESGPKAPGFEPQAYKGTGKKFIHSFIHSFIQLINQSINQSVNHQTVQFQNVPGGWENPAFKTKPSPSNLATVTDVERGREGVESRGHLHFSLEAILIMSWLCSLVIY